MARRQGESQFGSFVGLVGFSAATYFLVELYYRHFPIWLWGCAGVAALSFWLGVVIPTKCDYPKSRGGQPCLNDVHGQLRGCRHHRRAKRDAVWRRLGLRNPGEFFRIDWSEATDTSVSPEPGRTMPQYVGKRPPTPGYAYHAVMLACSVLSTIVTLAGLIFTVLTTKT